MELKLKVPEVVYNYLLAKFKGDLDKVGRYFEVFLATYSAHIMNFDHYHDDDSEEEFENWTPLGE